MITTWQGLIKTAENQQLIIVEELKCPEVRMIDAGDLEVVKEQEEE
ncbi:MULTISPECIES: hypothetical protein [Archaeoglobus]|jgi:hypothetical protein|uniref:Uncharacterized protein n=2 Tax=Archaeoglobus fulgidus TaxID=2234 RepID=A0A075WAM4_ARCFL|nr:MULTISPECIES: hypothetical protein [Archaeoglobus]AIG97445.1 hypothetical protein AFULGI_00006440 [Archaeoglobus fulgidus DSM 8774]KUJ93077.1 MAG: hypothetical protein XD40_1705 [Archaeoglobus fulgidus]KUK06816.1 MAG: hypothetical protein XD48_0926 [Archaeoglobus fulgidus]MDI3498023.1 hypothetical protein [Archaeoglobus sp.]